MAHRIEIKGPFRYVLLGLVIVFFAGNWLAPGLLASVTGSGDRSWRLLRSGHVERYHRNLTDHWITAEKGTYKTGMFPALGDEDVVVEFHVIGSKAASGSAWCATAGASGATTCGRSVSGRTRPAGCAFRSGKPAFMGSSSATSTSPGTSPSTGQ
jgi:hypothetical protein